MKKIVLVLLVFTCLFSGCLETQLCFPSEHDEISVKKCTVDEITVYEKKQDISHATDSGETIYYDKSGKMIFQDYWFGPESCYRATGGRFPCTSELKKWNSNFDVEKCEWKTICSSGIFSGQ